MSSGRPVPRPWEESYRRQGRLYGGVRLDKLSAAWLDADPQRARLRWLDAGCGDGKGTVPLAARVHDVVAADDAIWALRRTREAFTAASASAPPLARADARAWPFRDGAFGAVRAFHLIGHVRADDRARALAEIHRLLAPGGTLLWTEFGTGDFRCGKGEEVEPLTFRRGFGIETHYFTADEMTRLAEAAGFVVSAPQPETFTVRYGGVDRPRERWHVVAVRD